LSNDEAGRRNTFAGAETRTQMLMLFDSVNLLRVEALQRQKNLEVRVKKLENRKWFNTGAAFGGGIIGGIVAKFFGKPL
jgi:hypothetical protein